MSDTAVLEALAQALAPMITQNVGRQFGTTLKHDTSSTSPSPYQYSHGPYGLFSYPGVDPVVFSSVIGADSIIGQLPVKPSLNTNPTYVTVTGVQDVSGAERNGPCDNSPIAGLMQACMTTSVFGKYSRATPVLDLSRLGAQIDRADPMDLRLVNTPLALGGPFMTAASVANGGSDVLTNEVQRKFWERNIAIHRLLAKQIWIGNPSTGNSAGGGYKEMTGLQQLVATGYVDAQTATTCPGIDSLITNANYGRIDLASGAAGLIANITNVWHQLKERARRAGVAPVRHVVAMRSNLFYELTAVWPCSYLTMRCLTASAGTPEVIDAQDAVRFRDEMRAGRYLLIDGERVEVQFDDGIPEKDGNNSGGSFPRGCFSSDIYFLPMSVQGGQSVLFMEYFQYSNPAIQDALGNMVLGRVEGPWITYPRQTNGCIQWDSEVQPRLVLRTPWLAARIQNIAYCPTQHDPEPFPADPYFTSGGVTSRSGPSYHSLWAA